MVKDIKNKNTLPVYFFHGEESFYIDYLSDLIEKGVLSDEEKAFNQTIVYASDVELTQVIQLCKEFPLGSEKKVVIIKEAQTYRENQWEIFDSYLSNIQQSTILVVNFKHKKFDKRKKVYKSLDKNKWIFESTKLYDNQVPNWISSQIDELGLTIDQKSIMMLAEFLGTDLSKIYNELKKLQIIVSETKKITPEIIEKNIGISKEYNVFELTKAFGRRDFLTCFKISNYLAKNEKENPLVMIIPQLFSYFSNLLLIHCLNDTSKSSVASALKINPFFADDYLTGFKNYKLKEVTKILEFIKIADLNSKGIGTTGNVNSLNILPELTYKILNYRT